MLDQIAKSYLYEEYSDDQDLQAFMAAYNLGAEYMQDFWWENILAFWPGLQGDILEWCGEGIYGLPKTSIAGLPTQLLGPLNTEVLDSATLNSSIASVQPVYAITDDLYQRILTWHLYRGDTRNFSIRWLKRRIMRFLVGTAGLDPQPELPGFTVGCENTSAISVQFENNVCTVTISQTLLALLAQVSPNTLNVFAAAFESGQLELPLPFSYQVNLISPFTAILLPPTIAEANNAANIMAGPATITAAGNQGPLTYQWNWVSVNGQAVTANPPGIITDSNGLVVWDSSIGISIDEPTAPITTFTAMDLAPGETRTGVASCLITDTGSFQTITLTCTVTISNS